MMIYKIKIKTSSNQLHRSRRLRHQDRMGLETVISEPHIHKTSLLHLSTHAIRQYMQNELSFIITINDSPFLAVTHSLEYVIEIRTAINDNHIYRKT